MIWKAKYAQQNFPAGSVRLKRVFALLPTHINDDMIWLARYEILQVYNIEHVMANNDGVPVSFKVSKWTDVDKRFIK